MIVEICIYNFKSLVEASFSLANLNLLTGVNNSGKSSVIQALRIIELADSRQADGSGAVEIPELPGHGAYLQLQNQEEAGGKHNIVFTLKNGQGSERKYSIGKDGKCNISSTESVSANQLHFLEELQYIGADRLGPQVYLPRTNFGSPSNGSLGEHGQNSYRFLAEHEAETIHPPVVEKKLSLRQAVDAWTSEIAPGIEMVAQSLQNLDVATLQVNGYRPTNVGFGVSYTLPVIIALLAFSAKPKITLCLENPEAHLHPRAQTKIGELIARCATSGTQIVLETHSDHLLDGIRIAIKKKQLAANLAKVYFFSRSHRITEIESLSIDANGNIDSWPEGFFDQFMVNGKELLQ